MTPPWHQVGENLKKLHLKTKITDKALDTGAIGSLEYLNLYKTSVTDAGLVRLNGLKNLKTLYLQTRVTEPKVKAFQDASQGRQQGSS